MGLRLLIATHDLEVVRFRDRQYTVATPTARARNLITKVDQAPRTAGAVNKRSGDPSLMKLLVFEALTGTDPA